MPDQVPGMSCATCRTPLVRETFEGGSRPACPHCAGTALTVALLRRIAPKERVNAIWNAAAREGPMTSRGCPSCGHPMRVGHADVGDSRIEIDACRTCQLLWFDGGELAAFSPERQEPDADAPDPSAESHARWMAEHRRQMRARLDRTLREMSGQGGFTGLYLASDWY